MLRSCPLGSKIGGKIGNAIGGIGGDVIGTIAGEAIGGLVGIAIAKVAIESTKTLEYQQKFEMEHGLPRTKFY